MSHLTDEIDQIVTHMQGEAGTQVTYTPSGGSASVIDILWFEKDGDYNEISDGRVFERWGIAIVYEADVAAPGKGDKFTLAGLTWAHRSNMEQVGSMHRMVFVSKDQEEFGSPSRK